MYHWTLISSKVLYLELKWALIDKNTQNSCIKVKSFTWTNNLKYIYTTFDTSTIFVFFFFIYVVYYCYLWCKFLRSTFLFLSNKFHNKKVCDYLTQTFFQFIKWESILNISTDLQTSVRNHQTTRHNNISPTIKKYIALDERTNRWGQK